MATGNRNKVPNQGLPTYESEQDTKRRETSYDFDGGAARQLNAAPQILPQEPEQVPVIRPEVKPSHRPSHKQLQKNRRRALAMSPLELICLAVGVIMLIGVAVDYLRVQTDMDSKLKEIQSLEKTVATMKLQNDAKELEIKTGIDYQAIYDTATKELGMYYPGKDQVLYYQTSDSEYFEMNASIPN